MLLYLIFQSSNANERAKAALKRSKKIRKEARQTQTIIDEGNKCWSTFHNRVPGM